MDIARQRLISQQIERTGFNSVREVTAWMGAIQAQDYGMAKWAVGLRLPGCTDQAVEDALSRGEIIRTHVLRPTWHLVAATDLRWMLELSAARIKSAIKSYQRGLGITAELVAGSNALLSRVLKNNRALMRSQLVAEFQRGGFPTDENRAAHLLLMAELDGLICSGPLIDQHQTYALLEERIPQAASLTRAEALAELARRYFTSRAPATLQDFTWWSGLSRGEAGQALEALRSEFACETSSSQTYWFSPAAADFSPGQPGVHLLPGFDEFIISYQDRSASLAPGFRTQVISSNGIFRPVILVDGQVAGLWSKTTKKERVHLHGHLFSPAGDGLLPEIEKKAARYSEFLNKPASWETTP